MARSLSTINKYIKSNRGVAMVEFALVLPVLLLLLGGIIDCGYIMHRYLVVDEIARATSRYLTVNNTNDRAQELALNGRTYITDWGMAFDFNSVPRDNDGKLTPGSTVPVTVSCNVSTLTGLTDIVLPKGRITRTVSGRIE